MRSKDILSIIAFISAFVVSAAFASLFIDKSQPANFNNYAVSNYDSSTCSAYNKNCTDISALLIQDIRNGERRVDNYDYSFDEDSNVSVNRADAVAEYSNASSSMEDSHLPSDFRWAWHAHMQAWREYSEFLSENSRNKIDETEFNQKEDQLIGDINQTWARVLKIGRAYGVNNPYIR